MRLFRHLLKKYARKQLEETFVSFLDVEPQISSNILFPDKLIHLTDLNSKGLRIIKEDSSRYKAESIRVQIWEYEYLSTHNAQWKLIKIEEESIYD